MECLLFGFGNKMQGNLKFHKGDGIFLGCDEEEICSKAFIALKQLGLNASK